MNSNEIKETEVKTWFASDIHFLHENIIQYCNRPFKDVHHMNETLIKNWNSIVEQDHKIFVGGDVCMGRLTESIPLVSRLNGRKFLIAGNHDSKSRTISEFAANFEWIKDYHEMWVPDLTAKGGKRLVVMSHFPFAVWHMASKGSYHLCGHSHGSYKPSHPNTFDQGKILDIGVDCHNYFPISLEAVMKICAKKEFVSKDHHNEERTGY